MLYVAEPGQLERYSWSGLIRTVVARGLPDADGLDRLKGVAVGADHTVYVGVGSESLAGGPPRVVIANRPDRERLLLAGGVRNVEARVRPGGSSLAGR